MLFIKSFNKYNCRDTFIYTDISFLIIYNNKWNIVGIYLRVCFGIFVDYYNIPLVEINWTNKIILNTGYSTM